MTTKQIELVENSWDFIILNTEEAGIIFYDKLFEIAPELRPMFKGDISEQAKKLISLITFAVHKLRTLDTIVADVKALGARHAKYSVKPEHYAIVAQALLWTLEQAIDDWNDELRDAWVAVYTILSTTMIQAAKQASNH